MIEGKASSTIGSRVCSALNDIGVPTISFAAHMREQLIREEIAFAEIVCRNVAASSSSAPLIEEGTLRSSSNFITRTTRSASMVSEGTSRRSAGQPAGDRRHHGAAIRVNDFRPACSSVGIRLVVSNGMRAVGRKRSDADRCRRRDLARLCAGCGTSSRRELDGITSAVFQRPRRSHRSRQASWHHGRGRAAAGDRTGMRELTVAL